MVSVGTKQKMGAKGLFSLASCVRWNRKFMIVCSYWAAVNREFNFPTTRWFKLSDRITMLWSLIIILTSASKFYNLSPPIDLPWYQPSSVIDPRRQLASWNWADLLQLNYLPHIKSFGPLYYGLIIISLGTSLIWRLYLAFIRPNELEQSQWRWPKGTERRSSSSPMRDQYVCSSKRHEPFDPKLETINFFIWGPRPEERQDTGQLIDYYFKRNFFNIIGQPDRVCLHHYERSQEAPDDRRRPDSDFNSNAADDERSAPNSNDTGSSGGGGGGGGLPAASQTRRARAKPAAVYASSGSGGSVESIGSGRGQTSGSLILLRLAHERAATTAATASMHTYRVPIGGDDFLHDKSERRWRALARHVHCGVLLITLCALPLTALTCAGLNRVNERFGPKLVEGQRDMAEHLISRRQLTRFLRVYGRLEQIYAITQVAIFFVFTNIIITLFHADLIYKVRPILEELGALSRGRASSYTWHQLCRMQEKAGTGDELYDSEPAPVAALRVVHGCQLRIWSYFNQIKLYDSFMSRYAAISLAHLAIGMTLGQSFVQLDDIKLQTATVAAIMSNMLSFIYLHVLSEHIEQKSYTINRRIFVILKGERNPVVKREWQRILYGFFMTNQKRTFTMMGRFPTNIGFFIKALTALLAVCMLIHRLFHRHQWNEAFARGLPPPLSDGNRI